MRPCHALQFFRASARSATSTINGVRALALLAMLDVTVAQHTDTIRAALVTANATVDPERGLETAGAGVRRLGESCNSGTTACDVDVWCDLTTEQLENVGRGYYSPNEDCSRSSCTSMESEGVQVLTYGPYAGNPSHTASGGGVDQCPWACGSDYYDAGATIVFMGTLMIMCKKVGEGECSPPGSNSVSQW